MRPPKSLPLLLFLFPCLLQAGGPDTSEMEDRTRGVLLNRAVPLMESALRSAELPGENARTLTLLLEEQRRTLLLFLNFSGLTGDDLQAKLQQVMDVTRAQTEAAVREHPAP